MGMGWERQGVGVVRDRFGWCRGEVGGVERGEGDRERAGGGDRERMEGGEGSEWGGREGGKRRIRAEMWGNGRRREDGGRAEEG